MSPGMSLVDNGLLLDQFEPSVPIACILARASFTCIAMRGCVTREAKLSHCLEPCLVLFKWVGGIH
jgi:hypothetical protein